MPESIDSTHVGRAQLDIHASRPVPAGRDALGPFPVALIPHDRLRRIFEQEVDENVQSIAWRYAEPDSELTLDQVLARARRAAEAREDLQDALGTTRRMAPEHALLEFKPDELTAAEQEYIAINGSPAQLLWLAGAAELSQQAQVILAQSIDGAVVARIAARESLSPVVQATLLDGVGRRAVAAALAAHPEATAETLSALLANEDDPKIRALIAAHSNISDSDLAELVKHKDEAVRTAALKHPSTKSTVVLGTAVRDLPIEVLRHEMDRRLSSEQQQWAAQQVDSWEGDLNDLIYVAKLESKDPERKRAEARSLAHSTKRMKSMWASKDKTIRESLSENPKYVSWLLSGVPIDTLHEYLTPKQLEMIYDYDFGPRARVIAKQLGYMGLADARKVAKAYVAWMDEENAAGRSVEDLRNASGHLIVPEEVLAAAKIRNAKKYDAERAYAAKTTRSRELAHALLRDEDPAVAEAAAQNDVVSEFEKARTMRVKTLAAGEAERIIDAMVLTDAQKQAAKALVDTARKDGTDLTVGQAALLVQKTSSVGVEPSSSDWVAIQRERMENGDLEIYADGSVRHVVRIEGEVLLVEPDKIIGQAAQDQRTIVLADGRVVETNHIQAEGIVPEDFRSEFADNARWATEEDLCVIGRSDLSESEKAEILAAGGSRLRYEASLAAPIGEIRAAENAEGRARLRKTLERDAELTPAQFEVARRLYMTADPETSVAELLEQAREQAPATEAEQVAAQHNRLVAVAQDTEAAADELAPLLTDPDQAIRFLASANENLDDEAVLAMNPADIDPARLNRIIEEAELDEHGLQVFLDQDLAPEADLATRLDLAEAASTLWAEGAVENAIVDEMLRDAGLEGDWANMTVEEAEEVLSTADATGEVQDLFEEAEEAAAEAEAEEAHLEFPFSEEAIDAVDADLEEFPLYDVEEEELPLADLAQLHYEIEALTADRPTEKQERENLEISIRAAEKWAQTALKLDEDWDKADAWFTYKAWCEEELENVELATAKLLDKWQDQDPARAFRVMVLEATLEGQAGLLGPMPSEEAEQADWMRRAYLLGVEFDMPAVEASTEAGQRKTLKRVAGLAGLSA
jgi:hypothetical protein